MVVVNNTTAGKINPTIVKNLFRIQQASRTEPVFLIGWCSWIQLFNNRHDLSIISGDMPMSNWGIWDKTRRIEPKPAFTEWHKGIISKARVYAYLALIIFIEYQLVFLIHTCLFFNFWVISWLLWINYLIKPLADFYHPVRKYLQRLINKSIRHSQNAVAPNTAAIEFG